MKVDFAQNFILMEILKQKNIIKMALSKENMQNTMRMVKFQLMDNIQTIKKLVIGYGMGKMVEFKLKKSRKFLSNSKFYNQL